MIPAATGDEVRKAVEDAVHAILASPNKPPHDAILGDKDITFLVSLNGMISARLDGVEHRFRLAVVPV